MNLIKGSKQRKQMESKIDIQIIKKCKKKSYIIQNPKELQVVTHLIFNLQSQ
jgi:hypothetical protein